MAKRFECPRCGSGVKPDDSQCFRCGEVFEEYRPAKQNAAPEPATVVAAVHEKQIAAKPKIATAQVAASPVPKVNKHVDEKEGQLEKKAKELAEKEKAIVASVEQLEEDTKSLEEAIKRFELEDSQTRERERILKEREAAFESLATKMEEGLNNLETKKNDPSMEMSQDVEKIKRLSEDYSRRITEESRRQKQLLDREIEERMERLKTLQGLINAASNLPEGHKEALKEPTFEEAKDTNLNQAQLQEAVRELEKEMRPQISAGVDNKDFEIIPTHDERLDSILGGGIPAGHVVIVNGGPGSMKSSLTYYVLYNAAVRSGKKSMYFSLEQKRDSIIRQMEKMNMPRAPAEKDMLVVDMVDLRKAMQKEEGDWRQIMMRYVKNIHSQMPFDLFVLDSLDSFKGVARFEFTRQSMKDLFDWFKEMNITVLVITEKPIEILEESAQGETYLADGVIELLMKEIDGAKVYRWLRCVKMRGMHTDSRYYAFYYNGTEFKFSLPLTVASR